MHCLSFSVLLTIFCCVLCSNEGVTETDKTLEKKDSAREDKQLREPYEQEGWRAIGPNNWQNSQEWIPKTLPLLEGESPPPRQHQRRRRIRKRKRRPVVVLESEESEEYLPRRRRVRPHTLLEDINVSWIEAEDESFRRPYNRRRTTPVYVVEINTENTPEDIRRESLKPPPKRIYEKVRNPFTALEEAEAKVRSRKKPQEHETTTIANLKALLKQTTGPLSLSEILQKRNLSLADLLKGKQHAISALTENPETTTETTTTEDFAETSSENELVDNKTTIKINYETEESTKKSQEKTPAVKNYEVITEPTTERRIFVPSHPKHYTFYNYKPRIFNQTSETTTTQTTRLVQFLHSTTNAPTTKWGNKYLDYRLKTASLKTKVKLNLPITNAKLTSMFTSKKPKIESTTQAFIPLPSQAFKIDLKDVFGISGTLTKNKINESNEEKLDEGPVKMTINIEHLMKKAEAEMGRTTTENSLNINLRPYNSENEIDPSGISKKPIVHEKIKPTSAREEIMEILRDHISRQNLSRILELRNMTIEELVAQRERGSSHLHLADIFHNQTREPEPPKEPFVGHIRSAVPPFFDRHPKTINPSDVSNKAAKHSNNFTSSIVNLKPSGLHYSRSTDDASNGDEGVVSQETSSTPKYTITSFPTYKIEMEKIMKHNQPPPFQISMWKNLYPNLYTGDSENTNPTQDVTDGETKKVVDIFENDIRRVEDIDSSISDIVNSQLNADLNENVNDDNYGGRNDYIKLPRGVKSAIIASAAIIGFSVFVFLAVLFICKWSQKQKKRLCYTNNLFCSRVKSPILEMEPPRRTFRTIMNETLGRKKRYSHVYPQSMSDHSWQNDKKPFQ